MKSWSQKNPFWHPYFRNQVYVVYEIQILCVFGLAGFLSDCTDEWVNLFAQGEREREKMAGLQNNLFSHRSRLTPTPFVKLGQINMM